MTDSTIESADFVTVTFEDQKNRERMETVTMQCSFDLILCPVRSWAKLIRSILTTWGGSEETFVSSYKTKKTTTTQFQEVTIKDMNVALRAAAMAYGLGRLGFKEDDLGTHSIRSGAAMAKYLSTPSCSLVDGQAMLSCGIFGNK